MSTVNILCYAEIPSTDQDIPRELSVGQLLERANRNYTPDIDEPTLIGGDIAIKSEADRNADPCTSRSCMWGKWSDGKVYVPYYIANHYCFNHEQTRSDRDNYIRVYWENILDDMEYNFYKIDTLNQGTPYDYNSLMQYERYAFSKNNQPTMVPIPNRNVMLGGATQMSKNDIDRLNRLYQCCKYTEPKTICKTHTK
ncbi:unnamed protein product [Oreochromis niloticus]|nr:unnamed protein product [Mustela putorius furo]